MITTGFDVTIKLFTATVCTCSNDTLSFTAGTCTCTKIPYIDTCNVGGSCDMIDYTGFGDKLKKNIAGFPDFEITFSGGLDLTDAQQLSFFTALVCTGTKAQRCVRIYNGGKTETWRGFITGHAQGGSVGGKSTFSATLKPTILPKIS